MKRKFDRLQESLAEYLQQDDYPMLVVGCKTDELAYVAQFLKGLGETLPAHLLVVFAQPFIHPAQWIDAMLEGLRPQLQVLTNQRAEAGEPPPPALPLDLEDARCPPVQRLHALLHYLLALLPDQDDYRLAVGLLPLECADPRALAELIATLVPHPEIPAWMAPGSAPDRLGRPRAPLCVTTC